MPGPLDGLPGPPSDLAAHLLPMRRLGVGTRLWRVRGVAFGPIWFGPAKGQPPQYRSDDPNGTYSLCYLAAQPIGAFVETFLRELPARAVSRVYLAQRALSECVLTREFALVAAYGKVLVRLGTTAALTAAKGPGDSYAHSQRWSRAPHDHPDAPAGILFRSSHDPSLGAVALFGC